jgi:glycosyltransferase involved in cell wall biosynthesis
MSRSIIYDITPLARRSVEDVGGVDRVAFAYGRHFAEARRPDVWGAFYGPLAPHLLTLGELEAILRNAEHAWRDDTPTEADRGLAHILDWLGARQSNEPIKLRVVPPRGHARATRVAFHVRHWLTGIARPLPSNAVYLNVFNAGREHRFLFDWLRRRRDVQPVFFVHDLLPLDYPEYFRPGHVDLTRRRLDTIARDGTAYITSTKVVRDRLVDFLRQLGRTEPRVHVAPLPSPLLPANDASIEGSALQPYFVMIGTIEPRKNHLLMLNLWRELALSGSAIPKLVAVGAPGWENEQALDMFERCTVIHPHVLRVPRLPAPALGQLIAHAQALLMPSFDEGYGLPVVEALTLGTPVIASDISVFREITQGCATLLPPLNGSSWRDTILAFAERQSPAWQEAKATVARFHAPNWRNYFKGVESFLDAL